MPNPAWDDPLTSHVFHSPLQAPTPSAPDLEDLTHSTDALRQMIEAAENMDDEYSEPAARSLSRLSITLFRGQLNLEGLNDAKLAVVDRWFVIDAVPEESHGIRSTRIVKLSSAIRTSKRNDLNQLDFKLIVNFLKSSPAAAERPGQIPSPITRDLFKLCR
jgi:hypothetical protein